MAAAKTPEDEFVDRLEILANMVPNYVLMPETVAMYTKLLAPLGWEKLCKAVEGIMLERSSRDPFPSVKEIAVLVKPELSSEGKEVQVPSLIFEAVRKDGWTNPERARRRMGELAWAVVGGRSGYVQLCQSLDSKNETQYRAQLRDVARDVIKRGITAAPDLPQIGAPREEGRPVALEGIMKQALDWKKDHEPV